MTQLANETLAPAALDQRVADRLTRFVRGSRFHKVGAVVTDLDGTAVHEDQGRVVIPRSVELSLMRLVQLGRPLMLNTLRFPLSVLRTFGREWYGVSGAPLPTVTLNGSLLGNVVEQTDGSLEFEEVAAFPLQTAEIERALAPVKVLLDDGIRDVLVFYYPRDWRMGELIWTPVPEKVMPIREKYVSASAVTAVEFGKLRDQLCQEETCMIFLLVNVPQDRRMAYQHTQGSHFFTTDGVDKLSGARVMATKLGIELEHSLGAGDTPMDSFLAGVGCAVVVGDMELPFRGLKDTLRVPNSPALGELLGRLTELEWSSQA
jgi:hydroxymethylpyrimidine pyrophosphatase-like HAD family hydrolase